MRPSGHNSCCGSQHKKPLSKLFQVHQYVNQEGTGAYDATNVDPTCAEKAMDVLRLEQAERVPASALTCWAVGIVAVFFHLALIDENAQNGHITRRNSSNPSLPRQHDIIVWCYIFCYIYVDVAFVFYFSLLWR